MKLAAIIALSLSTLALAAPADVPGQSAHNDTGPNFDQETAKSLLGNVNKAQISRVERILPYTMPSERRPSKL